MKLSHAKTPQFCHYRPYKGNIESKGLYINLDEKLIYFWGFE